LFGWEYCGDFGIFFDFAGFLGAFADFGGSLLYLVFLWFSGILALFGVGIIQIFVFLGMCMFLLLFISICLLILGLFLGG